MQTEMSQPLQASSTAVPMAEPDTSGPRAQGLGQRHRAAAARERAPALTVGLLAVAALPLLCSLAFVLFADAISVDVGLSFLVLGLALSGHGWLAVRGHANSAADASVFVFGLMFLLVAPMVQVLVLGTKLVNTTYARADLVIQTNLACALFVAAYLLGRAALSRPAPARHAASDRAPGAPLAPGLSVFALAALLALCAFITLVSLPFIGASAADQGLTPVLLAFRKFLFFVPTAVFLIVLAQMRNGQTERSFMHLLLMLALLALVLATQNPATEKRNGLGPVYLAALFLLFRPLLLRKGVQVAWLVGVLLLLFPLAAVLTVVPWSRLDEVKWSWDLLADHFLNTHYDAWANIYSAIEITGRNGYSLGRQLAGALLFYVPSQWWPGKPLATGIEIGHFLMTYYTMWFTNLSAPLVAEGFIDFGYIGVAAYALALAALVRAIEAWAAPARGAFAHAIAAYLAFFIVFLLRGSLIVAVAYGFGALAAFFVSQGVIRLLSRRRS